MAEKRRLSRDGRDGRDGKEGPPGRDGRDCDEALLHTLVKAEVARRPTETIKEVTPVVVLGQQGPIGPQGERGADGLEGPEGPIGPMPLHEWDNEYRLRFEKDVGVWGPWSESLRGPLGHPGQVALVGGGPLSIESIDGGTATDGIRSINGGDAESDFLGAFTGGAADGDSVMTINGGGRA